MTSLWLRINRGLSVSVGKIGSPVWPVCMSDMLTYKYIWYIRGSLAGLSAM